MKRRKKLKEKWPPPSCRVVDKKVQVEREDMTS
jgi:hypothetical protein